MIAHTEAATRLAAERPELAVTAEHLVQAAQVLVDALAAGGTMFLAGNGGSLADALHIAGELKKSFERPRPLPEQVAARLRAQPGGELLSAHLQAGIRAQVLGADPVLASAVDNDLGPRHVVFAQELLALARPGDCLLLLSTSGQSPSIVNVARVAQALELPVVLLTGDSPAPELVQLTTAVVQVPSSATAQVQSLHSVTYHALCRILEDTFFPAEKAR